MHCSSQPVLITGLFSPGTNNAARWQIVIAVVLNSPFQQHYLPFNYTSISAFVYFAVKV